MSKISHYLKKTVLASKYFIKLIILYNSYILLHLIAISEFSLYFKYHFNTKNPHPQLDRLDDTDNMLVYLNQNLK